VDATQRNAGAVAGSQGLESTARMLSQVTLAVVTENENENEKSPPRITDLVASARQRSGQRWSTSLHSPPEDGVSPLLLGPVKPIGDDRTAFTRTIRIASRASIN
jgi:hypothetical protein